jgi:ATP-dependent DNA ligase
VGTGYSAERLTELGAPLRKLETSESPFADVRPLPRGTHWTRPEFVAQIGFAEWTADGRLRQPRFLGLRDDKHPAEVVKEQADSEDDRLSLETHARGSSPVSRRSGR